MDHMGRSSRFSVVGILRFGYPRLYPEIHAGDEGGFGGIFPDSTWRTGFDSNLFDLAKLSFSCKGKNEV